MNREPISLQDYGETLASFGVLPKETDIAHLIKTDVPKPSPSILKLLITTLSNTDGAVIRNKPMKWNTPSPMITTSYTRACQHGREALFVTLVSNGGSFSLRLGEKCDPPSSTEQDYLAPLILLDT